MPKPTPQFVVGQEARTRYLIPGAGSTLDILGESRVKVLEVSLQKHGRGRNAWSMPRYKVAHNGGSGLWTYEDNLEPIA